MRSITAGNVALHREPVASESRNQSSARVRTRAPGPRETRTLRIDYWMGRANGEMSERYGKQLLENVVWRPPCAAKVGLGFTLSVPEAQSQIVGQVAGQVGQVLRVAEQQAIALRL